MAMSPRLLRPIASGYRYASLRQGLVAYWPMNETAASGDVLVGDETGRGNHLASVNSVPSATGKIGSGREFTAANSEYLSRNSNADLQFGDGAWSIACWVYVTSTAMGDEFIVGKDQSGGREFGMVAALNPSTNGNRFTADTWQSNGTRIIVNGPVSLSADFVNRWHHVAIVHDGAGVVSGYQNGALFSGTNANPTGTRGAGLTFSATATPFNVGRRSFSGFPNHVTGLVDELAKWNRALSTAEISTLYNNGNGINLAAPRPTFVAFSGVSNADAQDWVNRVYANGGTVSTSTANAVNSFCDAIDAAGIRDRFYRLNLFAGTGLNAALVPVYRGASLGGTQYGNATDTNVGPFVSGDYTETGASGGLVGNGSSKYLNTGLASNSLPSITSGHLSVYMRSNSISATQGLIGADDSVNRFSFFLRPSQILRGTWAEITNSTANNETTSFTTYPTNLYTFTRTAAAESVIYAGATASNTNTVSTSPTAISTPWFVFAANNNSSAANFSSARLAGYSIGIGMSAADMTAYNTAMAALQAALTRTA